MPSGDPSSFASFGELLKYLRQRARLTQRQLGIAVGYSDAQITRLESGQRLPDPGAVRARFIEALDLHDEPTLMQQLIDLAVTAQQRTAIAQDRTLQPSALTSLERRTNLPTQLTRFVGREREMAEVQRLLGTARLLTLTGSGGCGKTRLALEVATRQMDTEVFADGAWLIEFAPLSDPHLVASATTSALGLVEQPNRPAIETLLSALASWHTLLVFDNCEHLIDACAGLAERILRACPQVHLLATSREALRIPGEVPWRVPSLPTPDPEHLPPVEQMAGYPAVKLFTERGQAVQLGFGITAHNAAAIARICDRLDGIPLALELAAGRLQGLTVHEIAARLDNRFHLLTSGSRTALPRHQTLRATLEWSYALLSDPERVLLARLSVFAGGWTPEAAEVVCAGVGLRREDVLPLLLDLVRKSLVTPEQRDELTRYSMLETIRQYAAERLEYERASDIAALRDRHLDYYLAQAEQADQLHETEEAYRLFGQLEADIDNCRAALVHSSSMPMDDNRGLRLAAAFRVVWDRLNVHQEGREWLEELLPRAQAGTVKDANALLHAGAMAWDDGDDAVARPLLEQCIRLCREHNYFQVLPLALTYYAWIVGQEGGLAAVMPLLEESLAISQEHGYLLGITNALAGLSLWVVAFHQDERSRSRSLAEAALKAAQDGVMPRREANCLLGLAHLEEIDGNLGDAVSLLSRSVGIFQRVRDWPFLAVSLYYLGRALSELGEYGQATSVLEQSLATASRFGRVMGKQGSVIEALMGLGQVAHAQGDFDRADTMYAQVLAVSRPANDVGITARTLFYKGMNELARHDLSTAAKCFGEAAILFAEIMRVWFAVSLTGLAECARQMGHLRDAARICGCGAALMNSREQFRRFPMFYPPWGSDRKEYERTVTTILAQLDDHEIAAAWVEGQQMTLEQAVAYALQGGEADEPPFGDLLRQYRRVRTITARRVWPNGPTTKIASNLKISVKMLKTGTGARCLALRLASTRCPSRP